METGFHPQLHHSNAQSLEHEVFISYRSEDKGDAYRLCELLEQNGHPCWIAPRDIPGGIDWPTAIVRAIRACRIFVIVLSANSTHAKQISREVELADTQNCPIITFRIEDVQPPEGLAYFLGNIQWLDGFGGKFEPAAYDLARVVRALNNSADKSSAAIVAERPAHTSSHQLPASAKRKPGKFRTATLAAVFLLAAAIAFALLPHVQHGNLGLAPTSAAKTLVNEAHKDADKSAPPQIASLSPPHLPNSAAMVSGDRSAKAKPGSAGVAPYKLAPASDGDRQTTLDDKQQLNTTDNPFSKKMHELSSSFGPPRSVSLSSRFNVYGISDDSQSPSHGGIDGWGYAYSSKHLSGSLIWSGVTFKFGPSNAPDAVSGGTVPLPSGHFAQLVMLATALNGSQPDQTFVVSYTDGTVRAFNQTLSDWATTLQSPGEAIAVNMPYRVGQNHILPKNKFHLCGYKFNLDPLKTPVSLTLPNNRNVVAFAISLLGQPAFTNLTPSEKSTADASSSPPIQQATRSTSLSEQDSIDMRHASSAALQWLLDHEAGMIDPTVARQQRFVSHGAARNTFLGCEAAKKGFICSYKISYADGTTETDSLHMLKDSSGTWQRVRTQYTIFTSPSSTHQ